MSAEEQLTSVLHDLGTPLTVVSGFADLLLSREETLTAEQRHNYIERIQGAAATMREIIDCQRRGPQGSTPGE